MANGGARPGAGRPKGVPNKITTDLKEAILEAATLEGDKDGLVGYLRNLAKINSSAFANLIGKIIPLQIGGDPDGIPIQHEDVTSKLLRLFPLEALEEIAHEDQPTVQ